MKELGPQLDGARFVRHDGNTGITFAWWRGSSMVHGYDRNGQEVTAWTMGHVTKDGNYNTDDAEASISRHIADGYFPY